MRLAQIVLLFCISISLSAQVDTLQERLQKLINTKVPLFDKTTIDGKTIDSSYFKGRVTIISFFGFGCGPCYQELSILDEISKKYPKEQYQILLFGDATEKDLKDLRAYHSRDYRKLKRKLGVDSLAFDMIADCPESPVRFISRGCKGSNEKFRVYAWPTTFFVNRDGVIKDICTGFAMPRNKEFDDYFYLKLAAAEK